MNNLSTEERNALRESVHRLLNDVSDERAVRSVMETPAGYDESVWRQLADMGVVGLIVDEAYGGSGVGPMELEAVMEEVGAALLCSPLLASGVLTAALLQALGDEEANHRWLPQIASGECVGAVVLTGDTGCWTRAGVAVSAEAQDDAWRLHGHGSFVLHGQNADLLLVVANVGGEPAAFTVAGDDPGVTAMALPTFDHTLRLARIEFDGASAQRLEPGRAVWDAVEETLNLALVALAGEQAGGAQRCLDFTVEYAKTRIQFGRAIGSFQAIKHMAADLLLETESAISAARNAAAKLAAGSDDRQEAVSLAAFACADAFVITTATSIQMHGGIAFTWEHPAHLYLRRARSGAQLFGNSNFHRERYLQALGA